MEDKEYLKHLQSVHEYVMKECEELKKFGETLSDRLQEKNNKISCYCLMVMSFACKYSEEKDIHGLFLRFAKELDDVEFDIIDKHIRISTESLSIENIKKEVEDFKVEVLNKLHEELG